MKKYHINEEKKLFKQFKKNKTLANLNRLVGFMYDDLTKLGEHINETTTINIACGKGCAACCNTRVEITEPEAIFIYSYMKDNLNSEQLESIFSRIKEIVNITSQLKDKNDHRKLQLPCIFLNDSMCSIYEIRPFICREYHSADLQMCIKCYVDLEDNAGALLSNDIKDSYYRIFNKYMRIIKENKLEISSNEFLSVLLKVHTNKDFISNYLKKSYNL